MTWDNFCKWWIDLADKIITWFTKADDGGLNPITRLIIAVCILIVGRILIKLIMKLVRKISGVSKKLNVDVSIKTFTLSVVNVVMNLLLAILVLLILRVNFTSVSSILSAGTVAIGLSLQDLISAFASGVVLLNSKYFKTGDYIQIVHPDGNCEGTVSSVGILAITLETFDNQHVVVPNNKVLQGVITNYSTNPTRRAVLSVNVDFDTDIDRLKELLYPILTSDKRILQNPTPSIVVADINSDSIVISLRCYTLLRDYWDIFFYLREQVLLTFKNNKIKIPYNHVIVEDYKRDIEGGIKRR